MRYLSALLLLLIPLGMLLLPTAPPTVRADVGIPGPGAQTIYSVVNLQAAPLPILHEIVNAGGFEFSFFDTVPAGGTVEYHVRDMAEVPSPFAGHVKLSATAAFSATIAGYDYPATPTATRTVTPTATATHTPTIPPTDTPTPTRFELWLPVIK